MTSLGIEHMILKSSQGHVSWVAPGWHFLIFPLALELSLEAIFGPGWGRTESKVPYYGRFILPSSNRNLQVCLVSKPPRKKKMPIFFYFACRTLKNDVHFWKITPLCGHNGQHQGQWMVPTMTSQRGCFHPLFSNWSYNEFGCVDILIYMLYNSLLVP